jgi:hypothetical protein
MVKGSPDEYWEKGRGRTLREDGDSRVGGWWKRDAREAVAFCWN